MIPLFSQPTPNVYQSRTFGHWSYIRTRLLENLQSITTTYRNRKLAVKNTHFLVTALNNLRIATTNDPLRYAEIAAIQAPSALKGLGVGSELYVGKFAQTQRFFGSEVYEYVYLTHGDYGPELLTKPWQELRPIRCIAHPRTDFDFTVLAGQTDTVEKGHAVIELDMGLLAFQYYHWRQEQQRKPVEHREHTRQFLVKYPLVNLLHSYIDVAWVNSVFRGFQGAPHLDPIKAPLSNLPTSETYVDSTISQIVSSVESMGRTLKLEGLLQVIPTLDQPLEKVWKYPPLPRTTPASVIRWLSCLDWLEYSLSVLFQIDALKQNRTHLNELKFALRNLASAKTLQQLTMSLSAQEYLEARISSIRTYLETDA